MSYASSVLCDFYLHLFFIFFSYLSLFLSSSFIHFLSIISFTLLSISIFSRTLSKHFPINFSFPMLLRLFLTYCYIFISLHVFRTCFSIFSNLNIVIFYLLFLFFSRYFLCSFFSLLFFHTVYYTPPLFFLFNFVNLVCIISKLYVLFSKLSPFLS